MVSAKRVEDTELNRVLYRVVYYPQHCASTTRSKNACVGLAANLPATDRQIMGALVIAVPSKVN